MNERAPNPNFLRQAAKANIEGNVELPQTYLGMSIQILNTCFEQENVPEALRELLRPIADDEDLVMRTKKANAQHAYHGISRVLDEEEVRVVQQHGNNSAILLLANSLGITREEGAEIDDEDEETIGYELRAEERLTEDAIAILRFALQRLVKVFTEPDTKALFAERKILYSNWNEKTEAQQRSDTEAAIRITQEIRGLLTDQLKQLDSEENLTEEQSGILNRLADAIDRKL